MFKISTERCRLSKLQIRKKSGLILTMRKTWPILTLETSNFDEINKFFDAKLSFKNYTHFDFWYICHPEITDQIQPTMNSQVII